MIEPTAHPSAADYAGALDELMRIYHSEGEHPGGGYAVPDWVSKVIVLRKLDTDMVLDDKTRILIRTLILDTGKDQRAEEPRGLRF
jgi:hypothetical protein